MTRLEQTLRRYERQRRIKTLMRYADIYLPLIIIAVCLYLFPPTRVAIQMIAGWPLQ